MSEENHEAGPSLQGTIRLILATVVIATIWLVVLPWIAEFPSIRDRSERLEAAGIDPAAMFYTELPMMEPILERLERRR